MCLRAKEQYRYMHWKNEAKDIHEHEEFSGVSHPGETFASKCERKERP